MKRMISKTGAAVVAAIVLASSATTAAATDFSGIYGGLSAGKAFGDGTHYATGSATAYGTASPDTALVGGVFGWNQRAGDFVYGVEFGLSAGVSDGSVFNHSCACSSMQLSFDRAIEIGLRGGWVSGDTLFYGALGAAHLSFQERYTTISTPNAINMKNSDTVPYLGLGVEHAVAEGWSIRGEYRHYFNVTTTNPATAYPASLSTLSSGRRDYDFGVFAITLTRYF